MRETDGRRVESVIALKVIEYLVTKDQAVWYPFAEAKN
jgi:hypothetical protein